MTLQVYADIKSLNKNGFDIVKFSKRPDRYKLVNRILSKDEVMVLIDLVHSTKFLTDSKKKILVQKLNNLVSKSNRKKLSTNVHAVAAYDKTKMVDVFDNINRIQDAMQGKHQIQYKYLKYDKSLTRSKVHNSRSYIGTPLGIVFDEGFYYVAIYIDNLEAIYKFRVDRMTEIGDTNLKATKNEITKAYDIKKSAINGFGAYDGEKVEVTFRVSIDCISAFADRFGCLKTDDSRRKVKTKDDEVALVQEVLVSCQFFGWITGFEGKVQIVRPKKVLDKYKSFLESRYKEVVVNEIVEKKQGMSK
ncbi:MAG: WYL domain-containing protein [Coriobacteriales bacterium]|nr:WYL domain-containing protein [Coriobacteriales bacterium]